MRTGAQPGTQQVMRSRFRTRWAVVGFLAVGLLVALVLIVRDLGGDDVPEETGTTPAVSAPAR